MRKIAEKVALVAQICIAVIFVLTALLYVLGIIPQNTLQDNAVVLVVMIVLAVLFVGTSAYLLYMNFSELQNLKRILLYADAKSATSTNVKVVNKIAKSCANKIEGVHVKKTKIRADEKNGYTVNFTVEVSAPSVSPVLEQLRCLVEDSFAEALGLTFNTITFEVVKLKGAPVADVGKAKKKAQILTENAQDAQADYQNPTVCDGDCVVESEQPVDQVVVETPSETPVETTEETDEDDGEVEYDIADADESDEEKPE